MYVTFKDKGIELARQAVTEDEAGNYDKALQSYLGCLDYFKTYLKYEKNPKAREAITGKVRHCCRVQQRCAHQDNQGRPTEQKDRQVRVGLLRGFRPSAVQGVPHPRGVPQGCDRPGQWWPRQWRSGSSESPQAGRERGRCE